MSSAWRQGVIDHCKHAIASAPPHVNRSWHIMGSYKAMLDDSHMIHNEHGPAVIYNNGTVEFWLCDYYLDGIKMYAEALDLSKEETIILEMQYGDRVV